jgi:3-deoxy-D-manno-octulosonic-acid transferase
MMVQVRRMLGPEPRFVYFIYSFLMGLVAMALLPYWLVQRLRYGKYLSNLPERLGFSFPSLEKLPVDRAGAIWIHAVSVGEALSSVTLARQLKEAYPNRLLIVSTTTITGQALARERLPFADAIVYFPLDWTWCVRRALHAVRPAIVVILETEIWPNFLREAGRRRLPVVFVSGRISDRSFARWQQQISRFGFLLRPLLRDALGHARAFLMQSESDAERVRFLGAPAERVQVSGNLKYDQELPAETPLAIWLEAEAKWRGRSPIIVAGSVVATEEPLALIAFGVLQGEFSKALLVLAPRKPERFGAAAEFIQESQRKFVRRSALGVPGPGTPVVKSAAAVGSSSDSGPRPTPTLNDATGYGNAAIPDDATVVLVDSIGELSSLYRLADGVFVGGSLVPSGGHNILEAAAFGKVAVFGPSMENFAEISSRFVAAGAAVQVESPEDAGVAWIEQLRDPQRTKQLGEIAKNLVDASRGATSRAMLEIARQLESAGQ